MSWQLSLALKGDLQKFMDAEVKAGKQAVTTVVRRRTTSLKSALRRQVARAGLGMRLGKAIQDSTYPRRGTSFNIAGDVYSKAVVKRRTGGRSKAHDLITIFDEGATFIPGPGKKFLAIANPAVVQLGPGVKGRPRARSPSEFPKGSLVFRPTNKASVAMLVKRNDPTKVAFWLVKIVRIPKKLDVNKAYQRAIRGIDMAIASTWERNSNKVDNRFNVNT